jgi:hypothetical protein
MNEQSPPSEARTIAQELGADPAAASRAATDAIEPLSLRTVVRDLTRQYPLAMLGLAFMAGVTYAGGRLRRHG